MASLYKFPLKMHIGAPCKAIVKEGEALERGQCIAEPEGLGVKIHTSVSGTVDKITSSEIIIKAHEVQSKDYIRIKKCNTIKETCCEAGIVGAGGAGFPTYIKLDASIPDGYVIANCVECEPILGHNIAMIEQNPEVMLKGLQYAMEAVNAKNGIIAIKSKNKKSINSLTNSLSKYKNIIIKELDDIYPMGEERAIINQIFDKWLEPTQLPLEASSVVLNCETLCNITRAVEEGKPVIDKDVTVGGKLCNKKDVNIFFDVPIGTPVSEMIDRCGGIDGEYGEILLGGPYTGKAGSLDSDVVTKSLGGIVVTIPFPKYEGNVGLLVCACGANEDRLRYIASKMGAKVVEVLPCKNVENIRGVNKCKTPGKCPGQAAVILKFKKAGANRLIISNCSDCSNTVMNSAPQLGLGVYHHTDHVFRTVNHQLTRRLK
ncbi:MAG: proline reductase-associated electron transfer protein PrdC [Tissierellia bacterium]|nr:proline reductase-associated electron transfer protein PrdC [Tissierellia bacterium]MDD4780103.1 proline reductase-associated electron transfer protein PrdC [Tissierellia bacterium]